MHSFRHKQKINNKQFKWSAKHIKFILMFIKSTNIRLIMQNEINNWQEIGFFIPTYKTKHNMFPFARLQKNVSITTLCQKNCLGWKLSPTVNR